VEFDVLPANFTSEPLGFGGRYRTIHRFDRATAPPCADGDLATTGRFLISIKKFLGCNS
jgi:hypothetical protein